MNIQNSSYEHQNFNKFLFEEKMNRRILFFSALAILIQFAIFKYLYPFANYIHGDSFSYLNAADKNLTINTYLIGYSKFLRLVSVFAKPDIALVCIQYLLIQTSALFLLFTIFFFYRISRYMQIILLSFMVFNPLFLHLANLVSSDGLFMALSLYWFAALLWLIHRPSNRVIIWQALLLFMSFTIRYNAMIYPFISLLAFWKSPISLRKKIAGISFSFILCGWFVGLTMYQYKTLTGYWQYSPFSGWQFANNAMYAYRHVDQSAYTPVPSKYKALDNRIRDFYAKTNNGRLFPSEKALASTFYMWSPGMPLMKYRDSLFKSKDSTASELKKWASMGPFYKSYGLHIIKKYPLHFATWFLWPNSRKYYAPPLEFLETYNSGRENVTEQAKIWFGYKNRYVKTRMSNPTTWILDFYPILSGVINVLMIFSLLYYILLKGWKYNPVFNRIILIGGSVWLLNAGFTIFASSAALRFQSFPIILTTTLSLLLVDWMTQLVRMEQSNNPKQNLSTYSLDTKII